MPRNEYKSKDKKISKMTRNGVVEINKVTGEMENVSSREQDFSLRIEKPNEQNITADRNRTDSSVSQPLREASSHNQQNTIEAEQAVQPPPQNKQNGVGDSFTSVSGSAENSNNAAESDIRTEEKLNSADNIRASPKRNDRYNSEDTIKNVQPSSYHFDDWRSEPSADGILNNKNKELRLGKTAGGFNDIKSKAPAAPLRRQIDKPGRLQYQQSGDNNHSQTDTNKRNDGKNPQKGTQYHQRFTTSETDKLTDDVKQEISVPPKDIQSQQFDKPSKLRFTRQGVNNNTARGGNDIKKPQESNKYPRRFILSSNQPEKPNTIENRSTEQTTQTQQNNFNESGNPETAAPSKATDQPQSNKSKKLLFARDNILNHSDKNGKSRQKGKRYQQRFTPEAAKPLIIPNVEFPQEPNLNKKNTDTAQEKNKKTTVQSDSKISKIQPERSDGKQNPPPVSNKATSDKKTETMRLQVDDGKSSKLKEKSGKLKFNGDKRNKNNRKPLNRKKKRREIDKHRKTLEEKPVLDNKNPESNNKEKILQTKPDKNGKPPTVTPNDNRSGKSSRLNFFDDEKPLKTDKKLTLLESKAEKYNAKLDKAREKLPSKKQLKKVNFNDETKNKAVSKFKFEREILPPDEKKTVLPIISVKDGAGNITRMGKNKLHQKVSEVENENVGVEAGHSIERAAETAYRGGKRVTRSTFNYFRSKPYRTVEKLEKKAVKANIRYSYRAALNEKPKLKSNLVSRYMQKRKIRKQYAKAALNAKKAGKTAKKTGEVLGKIAKNVVSTVSKHPVAAVIIIIILLLIFFIASFISAFSSLGASGFSAFAESTYLAQDADINQTVLAYSEWETDLRTQIQNAETDYPGYNEYRYNIDGISHNPYDLLAFLTAVYSDFAYAEIEAVLQQIFNEQYQISFIPSVEIRYYEDEDGELIPYDWNVLTITLISRSLSDVLSSHMDSDQNMLYELLTMSSGNRQYVGSPFEFDWRSNVTSKFGYRIHPITGAKDFHKGIDIAVPVGTEIHSTQDGIVTFAGWNDSYGYYVVVENSNGLVTKYAHCDSLSVSAGQEVKAGNLIAKSGNTGDSTGPHLHFEVILNGEYLNPAFFAMTNTL